jgi:hypothetical protein
MSAHLRRDHEELLESLLSGKLPRDLSWSAVVDLIGQIGKVEPHGNDEFLFEVGSQRGLFKRGSGHNLDVEEISRLRRFLREAGVEGKTVRNLPTRSSRCGHRPSHRPHLPRRGQQRT